MFTRWNARRGNRKYYMQANRLGEYKLTGVLADRPIYKKEEGEEFLFYLRVGFP